MSVCLLGSQRRKFHHQGFAQMSVQLPFFSDCAGCSTENVYYNWLAMDVPRQQISNKNNNNDYSATGSTAVNVCNKSIIQDLGLRRHFSHMLMKSSFRKHNILLDISTIPTFLRVQFVYAELLNILVGKALKSWVMLSNENPELHTTCQIFVLLWVFLSNH